MKKITFYSITFAIGFCISALAIISTQKLFSIYSAGLYEKTIFKIAFLSALWCGIFLGLFISKKPRRRFILASMPGISGVWILLSFGATGEFIGEVSILGGLDSPIMYCLIFVFVPVLFATASMPAVANPLHLSDKEKTRVSGIFIAAALLGAVAGYLSSQYVLARFFGFSSSIFIGCVLVAISISIAKALKWDERHETYGKKSSLQESTDIYNDEKSKNTRAKEHSEAIATVVLGSGIFFASVSLFNYILHAVHGDALLVETLQNVVILVSLALGFLSSELAGNKSSTIGRASILIAIAGILIAAALIFRRELFSTFKALPFEISLLFSSATFFFLPSFLLSAAIATSIRSIDSLRNRASTNCWALMAIAMLTGAVISPASRLSTKAILSNLPSTGGRSNDLIEVLQSPYGEIRILEKYDARFMVANGTLCAEVDARNLGSLSPYVDVLELACGFSPEAGKMLLLGLGGGLVAGRFASKGWEIDAIEPDEETIKAASDFFGLQSTTIEISRSNARKFLRMTGKTWDLIVLDQGTSGERAYYLMTKEAFASMHAKLSPVGVLAINAISLGWHDNLVEAIVCTLESIFAETLVLPIAEPPNEIGNIVILASDRKLELPQEPPSPDDRFSREYNMAHAWDNRFNIVCHSRLQIADHRNNMKLLSDRATRAMTKFVHDYFGIETLIP